MFITITVLTFLTSRFGEGAPYSGIVNCQCEYYDDESCVKSGNGCYWMDGSCGKYFTDCTIIKNHTNCGPPQCQWSPKDMCTKVENCGNVTATPEGCKSYGCIPSDTTLDLSKCVAVDNCTVVTEQQQCENLDVGGLQSIYLPCGWHNDTNSSLSSCMSTTSCYGLPEDLCLNFKSCYYNTTEDSCSYVDCTSNQGLDESDCINQTPNCQWQSSNATQPGMCNNYNCSGYSNYDEKVCQTGINQNFCSWSLTGHCFQCAVLASMMFRFMNILFIFVLVY